MILNNNMNDNTNDNTNQMIIERADCHYTLNKPLTVTVLYPKVPSIRASNRPVPPSSSVTDPDMKNENAGVVVEDVNNFRQVI